MTANSRAVQTVLVDGPLAGQRVTVHAHKGGKLPSPILPHAPLPAHHDGEPGPRHEYYLTSIGSYQHSRRCDCLV